MIKNALSVTGVCLAGWRKAGAAGVLALGCSVASAQSLGGAAAKPEASSIAERYKTGSIQSVQAADTALAEAAAERARIEARFVAEEQSCHSKFFATSCIDDAKERRHEALSQIRPIEIEANKFKRKSRLNDREKALQEKQARRAAERLERSAVQSDTSSGNRDLEQSVTKMQPTSGRAVHRDGVFSGARDGHNEKPRQHKEREIDDPVKRAENVAAYERKVQALQARQKELAEKRAVKAEKKAKATNVTNASNP